MPPNTVFSDAHSFYPIHLPDQAYTPGPELFPRVIASFRAKLDQYNANTWADHMLMQAAQYPASTVVSSFMGMLAIQLGLLKEVIGSVIGSVTCSTTVQLGQVILYIVTGCRALEPLASSIRGNVEEYAEVKVNCA